MQILSFYNNKGGVGKTTSVINIAFYLQKQGKKVLVADCDSQKNSFGFFSQSGRNGIIRPTKYDRVSLTTWEQISYEITALHDAEKSDIFEGFDCLILDLPPAMTDDVKQIIRVSDYVFVPTMLGEFEIAGLQNVTEEIQKQGTKLGGVFVTMFNKKNDGEVLKEFEQVLKKRLMSSVIPFSPTVRESQKAGLSLEEYFDERQVPRSPNARKAAAAYESLTDEILRRCGG